MPHSLQKLLSILCLVLLIACTNTPEQAKDREYETTKQMIVDILQTEEGKKALSEILNDEAMKQRLVIESDIVKNAISDQLLSDEGQAVWTNYFNDPKFSASFAAAMEPEHIALFKKMMHDAEFQQQMIELMQDPELMNHLIVQLQSQAFRAHLEKIIEQALETPAFQEKINEMVSRITEKSADEKKEPEATDDSSDNEQENDDG